MGARLRLRRMLAMCMWLLPCLPATAGDIDQRLRALMAAHDTVGLAVVVVEDNAIVHQASLGWKDREAGVPLDGDDLFRIASISKSFAAASVLQLAAQGRLSLDDDVGGLLGFPVRNPAFPDRPITVRMLLSHTSSITDAQEYFSLDIINPATSPDWRGSYADREPGARYEYANLGYNMLGAIVERVSGQRYDRYVREHLLEPLGLRAGYVVDELDAGRLARIYRWDEAQGLVRNDQAYAPLGERLQDYRIGYDAPRLSPTGGLKISAPDLATWMRVLMNGGEWNGVRVLSPDAVALMQAETVPTDDGAHYGFAIRTDRELVPGERMVGHTGSAYGLYSSMFFEPEKKFGFVVITNGTRDMAVRTAVNRALYQHFVAGTADAR
jgi:D-alanyl-D-alanine carboxypeptidase